MNRKINRFSHSAAARKLLVQCVAEMAAYVAALLLIAFVSWFICYQISWSGEELIYRLLHLFADNLLVILIFLTLIGWMGILYYNFSKAMRYLDQIVDAAARISDAQGGPIELPVEIQDVQNELNLVRERSLRNAAAAREAEQRKNDLIVYLAHDLKTPLTSVIGYLTLLRDEGQISEELRSKYLSISLEKAERLEDLINEFFEITRFNLSNITLEYSRVNLTRMLEQLTYEFQPMLLEKDLRCDLSAPPDLMLRCDVDKMQRVFDNLLRNAVNYSFQGSTISVSAVRGRQNITITFTNHGNTIPPEKLARIFEQFYRLDSARTTTSGGAGLGLAIAREIVGLHHGTITAQSAHERITFTVCLPDV